MLFPCLSYVKFSYTTQICNKEYSKVCTLLQTIIISHFLVMFRSCSTVYMKIPSVFISVCKYFLDLWLHQQKRRLQTTEGNISLQLWKVEGHRCRWTKGVLLNSDIYRVVLLWSPIQHLEKHTQKTLVTQDAWTIAGFYPPSLQTDNRLSSLLWWKRRKTSRSHWLWPAI